MPREKPRVEKCKRAILAFLKAKGKSANFEIEWATQDFSLTERMLAMRALKLENKIETDGNIRFRTYYQLFTPDET